MSIKEHIAGKVRFVDYHNGKAIQRFQHEKDIVFTRYRKGYLYFNTQDGEEVFFEVPLNEGYLIYVTSTGVEFRVPLSDIGDADFLAEDKGILFMRYIRKVV